MLAGCQWKLNWSEIIEGTTTEMVIDELDL